MHLFRAFGHLSFGFHVLSPMNFLCVFAVSHADSLTGLIGLIEQVRSRPREERGIY